MTRIAQTLAAVLVTLLIAVANSRRLLRTPGAIAAQHYREDGTLSTPGTANCTELYFKQKLDHFNFAPPTNEVPRHFQQRYYVCLEQQWNPGQPIFFYTGNEANVDLFVNMSGIMWENAAQFGAMLVFAEHRYFGKSLPFPGEVMPAPPKINFLQTDQALADFSTLIDWLKLSRNSSSSAVIGFGGSYGGMLCSWLRIKYPSALDGCIAGSAPIVNFESMTPPFNFNSFAQTETFDASTAGGANDMCKQNIHQAWVDMQTLGTSIAGRAQIGAAFRLCEPLNTMNDVWNLMNYAENSFGNMAMSSYPYPSAYLLLGGKGVLPAYPMRVACDFMSKNFSAAYDRLAGLRDAIGVYYNNTKDVMCLNPNSTVNFATEVVDYLWGYLSCTTMFMPDGQDGVNDMFWNSPWNHDEEVSACQQQWNGVTPQADWVQINYGGYGVSTWGSNIVFSNGQLDPWHGGGILTATAPRITTVLIPDVGHHIDLMFSNPKDTDAIRAARAIEVEMIGKWIADKQRS